MERHTVVIGAGEQEGVDPNRRRHGRVRCEQIESTLGPVLDISASGMRIGGGIRRYRRGAVLLLTVHTLDGSFDVRGRVSWSKGSGVLFSQIGLEFVDLCPEGRRILQAAVRSSRR